ncbi:hypothetical protein CAPN010_06440 [Capnocytophaga cynodegmi]|uniref:hypothetical protein n=1 Tax=Capnocytophaga cynodegmi TaxID=28189 RepID=UPI001EE1FE31|nr:hypothetical protein [Capnocytophaga cynodegmi]GJQ06486.1 hypothetical protein CAPN010_06440 [Capnocytophaga cynodegmi]
MNPLLTKNPYFNTSGLTSSEANYVCERIKERLKPIQNLVTNIATHTSSLEGEKLDNFKKVENIDEKLEKIGTLYAISAYLRSAIKEKDNRINEISQKILQIRQKVEEKVEKIDFEALDKLKNITIEDFLKTLSLEEVIKYKSCEAKAAHIGKFIHNFDTLREEITKKELISLRQVGEKVFKIINVPLYEIEELQVLQEKLLAQHREFESEVNFYKAKFREFENQSKVNYEREFLRISQAQQEKINQLVVSETAELIKIKEEIANFRIVIPNLYKTEIQDLLKK